MVVSNKVYTFVLEINNKYGFQCVRRSKKYSCVYPDTHNSFLKTSWSMKDKYSFFGMLIR